MVEWLLWLLHKQRKNNCYELNFGHALNKISQNFSEANE